MTNLSAQRWQQIKQVFAEMLARTDSGEDLVASLAGSCDDDVELQAEVRSLVEHYTIAERDSFLDATSVGAGLRMALPGMGSTAAYVPSTLVAAPPAAGSASHPPQVPGYRLLQQLGKGGMGEVWSAVQEGTEQEVAVKLIRPSLLDSPLARERFQREMRAAAKLTHRHIARVYAGNLDPPPPFYVMERIHGETLLDYVRNHRLPVDDILTLFHKICLAVQFAHKQKVLHRDLKPGNILVDNDGQPRVIDFGLARSVDCPDAPLTLGGLGTHGYAAPEQMAGRKVDARADVYSLGVTLQRVLEVEQPARQPPGDNVPTPPADAPSPIASQIQTIIARATATEPRDRYSSVAELAAAVDAFLAAGRRRTARRRFGLLATGAVVLVAALLTAMYWLRPHAKSAPVLPAELAARPVGPVLRTLLEQSPPATSDAAKPVLSFTLDARRSGEHDFRALNDGEPLASVTDEFFLVAYPRTDGYLYIFQVDSLGRVQWYFPKNSWTLSSGANPVRAGQLIQLPQPSEDGRSEAFYLDDITGYEHLYAVFSPTRWEHLERVLAKAGSDSSMNTAVAQSSPRGPIEHPIGLTRGASPLDLRGVGGKRVVLNQNVDLPLVEPTIQGRKVRLPVLAEQFEASTSFLVIERWLEHVPRIRGAGE